MHRSSALLALLAVALSAHALQGQASSDDPLARATARLAEREGALIALRHDLHQHPELSGAEVRTAGVIVDRLSALGLEVRADVGGHGVVGLLRGAHPGPVVAFRADMDAMPSDAPDPVEYRSLTPAVRHICGHDMHVTVGIALAEALASVRDALHGSVLFIFQPAEENGTGARAMLADGVFSEIVPDAVFALHTGPFPVGQLATLAGGMLAGRDLVTVTVTGAGDLGAAAEIVARVIASVGTIPPAMALQPAPEGFVLAQVFPDANAPQGQRRVVRAQITTADASARARAEAAIRRGLDTLALPDVEVALDYEAKALAGVTNDSALVARANGAIAALLGDTAVIRAEGIPPAFSEDFGSFQDHAPGVMWLLGVSNPAKGTVGMPHTPGYVADDGAILVGASAMSAVLLDWLAPPEGR
jgi:metal-dependent amidase/aminoacylase/carboxypeptidase family protein